MRSGGELGDYSRLSRWVPSTKALCFDGSGQPLGLGVDLMKRNSTLWLRLLGVGLLGALLGWYLSGSLLWTFLTILAVVATALYLPLLLDEPDFLPPAAGHKAGGHGAGHERLSVTKDRLPRAGGKPDLPTIQPAAGIVPAGSPGRGADQERDGLLRTLAEGPDFRRAPAAVALALHCSGAGDPEVVAALLDALANEEYETLVRVESLLALYRVLDKVLEADFEAELRQNFPLGVDWDFVEACRLRIEKDAE